MENMDWIGYLIIVIYIGIAFWAVLMWIDKMSKVIIWNYLAWITCYAFGNLINQWVNWLLSTPDMVFLWISYEKLANFLSASQLTLILLMFAGIIRLIYSCGRIQVSFGNNISTEKLYFVALIPITVLSFIVWPYMALKADWIQTLSFLESTITRNFGFLVNFTKNIPLRMFINWIAFIILSSQINFKISLSAKTTKLPEWL